MITGLSADPTTTPETVVAAVKFVEPTAEIHDEIVAKVVRYVAETPRDRDYRDLHALYCYTKATPL